MRRLSYLARHPGGIFYVQCRITMFSGRKRLLRLSLGVKDHRAAKPLLIAYLRWVLPMQAALDIRHIFSEIEKHGREIVLEGPTHSDRLIRFRYHFVKTACAHIVDWMNSHPSPILERELYDQERRLRPLLDFIWKMIQCDNAYLIELMAEVDDDDAPRPFTNPWPSTLINGDSFGDFADLEYPWEMLAADRTTGEVRRIPYPPVYDPDIFIEIPPSEARLRPNEVVFKHLYLDDGGQPMPPRPLKLLKGDYSVAWNSMYNKTQMSWFDGLPEEGDLAKIKNQSVETTDRSNNDTLALVPFSQPPIPHLPAPVSHIQVRSNVASPASAECLREVGYARPGHESEKLSASVKKYLNQKATVHNDRRADEDAGLILQFMIDFLCDPTLGTLTNEHLMAFEEAMAKTPDRKGLPAEHTKSLLLRYRYGQKNGLDGCKMISRKRISNIWHRCLHQYFAWLKIKSFAVIDYRFTVVPKSAPKSKERDSWENDELIRFFSLPLFTGCESKNRYWNKGNQFVQNELYWAYIIIFFTGMRHSEVGRLKVSEVTEKHGRWYFDLTNRDTKTDSSRRLVPISSLLIDLGLLDRKKELEEVNNVSFFPEWKHYKHGKSGREMPGHHLSKSWQYVKTKFKFDREDLTSYGARHTRAEWYDELKLPDRIRNRLLGHVSKTVAGRYGAKQLRAEAAEIALETLPIEEQLADILISAKLRSVLTDIDEDMRLIPVETWV
jgi:integrase